MTRGDQLQRSIDEQLNRSAFYCCGAVGLVVIAAGFVRHYRVPSHPVWVFALAGAVNLALAGGVYLFRRRPLRWPAIAASLLGAWVLIPAQWHSMAIAAATGRPWTPFQGIKLLTIVLAVLGPELSWLMVTNIVVLLASSLIQYSGFAPEVRARLAIDEPMATVLYGSIALLLFFYRHRRTEAARRAASAIAEAAGLQRMARMFLAVRDLTNTPLQTLQLCVELTERDHPELAQRVQRMKRSLERLKELDGLLGRYESAIDWRDTMSFDAKSVLRGDAEIATTPERPPDSSIATPPERQSDS